MKKFWHQYRIFIILMSIVLICMVIMGIILGILFFKGGNNKYGDRLDSIKNVKVTDKIKDQVISETVKDEKVTKAKVDVSGKTIYITIYLENVSTVIEAQGKVVNAINTLPEEIKKKYDIWFILLQDKTDKVPEIKIMGCQNVLGNGLVWNNNTEFEESEE